MGLLDGLLGQVAGNVDVANLATKIGLDPATVEKAIGALAEAHPQPGDTAQAAAASTGLPVDKLQAIIGHIGGEGSLGRFAELLGDKGGSLSGLGGMLGGLSGMLGKS